MAMSNQVFRAGVNFCSVFKKSRMAAARKTTAKAMKTKLSEGRVFMDQLTCVILLLPRPCFKLPIWCPRYQSPLAKVHTVANSKGQLIKDLASGVIRHTKAHLITFGGIKLARRLVPLRLGLLR